MSDRSQRSPGQDEPDRVIIRDKRKIDPVTGAVRSAPAPAHPSARAHPAAEPADEAGQVPMVEAALLDERTADLQRVQAEYANYRKRTDRDRLAAGDVAIRRVLVELLPVLDDIDRARTHDDLTGALKAVADHLEGIFSKLGLQAFGEVGDPFDPVIHEAVLHTESDDVSAPTATTVMRRGYQHGERLLRPAMVGVTEPASAPAPSSDEPASDAPVHDEAAGDEAAGEEPVSDEPVDQLADEQHAPP